MNHHQTQTSNLPVLPFRDPALPLETRVSDLVSRLSREEKINQICQFQDAVPRLGIAAYKHGTEAAHGISWLGKATTFPQPSGLACTWDTTLLGKVGEVIGTEARGFFKRNPAINGLTLWAPTVDLQRDPRWGRVDEAWGEDPVLAGKLAASLIRGVQGDHPRFLRAVSSPKHFLGNNNELDRGTCSVSIDPRNMHEYYLKPFEIAFREGNAQSMMTAYNAINGVPANLNPDIIRLVKQEWGMNGFVVSDAGDILGTVREHGFFKTFTEAVAMSIKAGIDSITDDHPVCKAAVKDALATGLLAESDLDAALHNTFRVRMRLGEFDPAEGNPYASIGEDVIACPAHAKISAEAAWKSIVLLKNDPPVAPLLPMDPASPDSIAVIGPLADQVFRDWYSGNLPYAVSPLDGIRTAFPQATIIHADGSDRFRLKSTSTGAWVGSMPATADSPAPRLSANTKLPAEASVFRQVDWGWGSSTLQEVHAGIPGSSAKWLTTDDRQLSFGADEIFGWFTKEVFTIAPVDGQSGDPVTLATWNSAPVNIDPRDGRLVVGSGLGPENQGPIGIAAATRSSATATRSETFQREALSDGIAEAVAAARQSHTAIVVVGNHPLVNGKETIDRPDIILPESQERLVRAVLAANPRTILVIVGSYPISPTSLAGEVPAILYLSHAGQETGNSLASVLGGKKNPAGRLAMTWYRGQDQLPPLMDYDVMRGKRTYRWFEGPVLWPFGHGLSYSRFTWSDLKIDCGTGGQCRVDADGKLGTPIKVSLKIHNASQRDGEEVVQMYLAATTHRLPMAKRQLAAFRRIMVPAGQSQDIEFTISESDLSSWDVRRGRFATESGSWQVLAGASSADIKLSTHLEVQGQAIEARKPLVPCDATAWDDCRDATITLGPDARSSVQCADSTILVYQGFACSQELRGFEALVGPEAGEIAVHLGSAAGPRLGATTVPAGSTWRSLRLGLEAALTPADDQTICLVAKGLKLVWFRFTTG